MFPSQYLSQGPIFGTMNGKEQTTIESFLKQIRPLPLKSNLICILSELSFIKTLDILHKKNSNVSKVLNYLFGGHNIKL